MRTRNLALLGGVALLTLLALPAAAADEVIYSGIDIWRTLGTGSTFIQFSKEPIPAGFFCAKSEPFTGRVLFRGVPILTADGSLGQTDTIVHRLDDAVFDAKGEATTRVQLRAMQFESLKPIKTACGQFNVRVHLDGDQPVTRMRIIRDDENGGHFLAPIALRVRISFLPVRGKARQGLEIVRSMRLRPNPANVWSYSRPEKSLQRNGFVLIDTNGDGRTDTFVPGTSNFAPGTSMNKYLVCHDEEEATHCFEPT